MLPRAIPAYSILPLTLLMAFSALVAQEPPPQEPPPPPVEDPEAPPAAPDSFFGQVLDPDGNPVPNATIRLVPPWDPKKHDKRPEPIVINADEQGRFEKTGLDPGDYQVQATGSGFGGYYARKFSLRTESLNPRLRPGQHLVGRFFDRETAEPIAGATVRICEAYAEAFGEGACPTLTTDDAGRFETHDVGPATVYMTMWAPKHAWNLLELKLPRAPDPDGTVPPLEFFLGPGGRVSGKVVDPDGEPVEHAEVRLTPLDFDRRRGREFWGTHATTDEAGEYTIHGVPADVRYTPTASARGFAATDGEPFEVERGDDLQDVTLKLSLGATLRVRLVDADELPVAKVKVDLFDPADEYRRRPTGQGWADSHEEGWFEIPHLKPGLYFAKLVPEDRAEIERKDLRLTDNQTTDLGTIIVDPGVVLAGRVTDDLGEPVKGALVHIWWTIDGKREDKKKPTREDGTYRFTGLAEIDVFMAVTSHAHVGARDHGVATGDEHKDFVLERAGRVLGVVKLPNGDPAPNFEARAVVEGNQRSGLDSEPEASDTFANAMGQFWLGGIDPGRYTIEIRAGGMRPARMEGVEVASGGEVDIGTLVVEPGLTLRGRIVDADTEAPITGATVRVTAAAASGMRAPGLRRYGAHELTQSGPDGSFELGGQEPGTREIFVERTGFAAHREQIQIAPGGDPPELVIRLGQGGTITGTVLDAEGRPMPGVALMASPSMDIERMVQGKTNEEGRYKLERVPPGAITIGNLEFSFKQATVQAGETTVVDFRESAGIKVTGRVLLGTSPLAEVDVEFRPQFTRAPPARTRTDGSGNYQVDLDGPGLHVVSAARSSDAPAEPVFQWNAPEGPEAQRDIVIYRGTLSGTVTDEDGNPLAGIRIMVAGDQPPATDVLRRKIASTGADGSYEVDDLAQDTYRVVFQSDDYPQVVRQAEIRGEDDAVRIDVQLGEGRVLAGRVVDPGGSPLERAMVMTTSGSGVTTRPVYTDVNGRFEIKVSGDGSVDLMAAGGGLAPVKLEGVVADPSGELLVRLNAGGSARIVATHDAGNPAAGVLVVAVPEDEMLQRVLAFARTPPQPTSPEGIAVQHNLAPGPHLLYWVTADGKAEKMEVGFDVREGEETTVEVTLPGGS